MKEWSIEINTPSEEWQPIGCFFLAGPEFTKHLEIVTRFFKILKELPNNSVGAYIKKTWAFFIFL